MTPADATLLGLVADLRAALGDPEGRLMQDELIAHARRLKTERDAAAARVAELRQLCVNVHDRLLRGDSDAELLAMLEAGWGP